MLDEFAWGRKDATSEAECGSLDNVPQPNGYIQRLDSLGFDSNDQFQINEIGKKEDESQSNPSKPQQPKKAKNLNTNTILCRKRKYEGRNKNNKNNDSTILFLKICLENCCVKYETRCDV